MLHLYLATLDELIAPPFLLDAADEKDITMGVTAYFLMRDEALRGRKVHFVNDGSYVDNQMDFLDKITDLIADGLIG